MTNEGEEGGEEALYLSLKATLKFETSFCFRFINSTYIYRLWPHSTCNNKSVEHSNLWLIVQTVENYPCIILSGPLAGPVEDKEIYPNQTFTN